MSKTTRKSFGSSMSQLPSSEKLAKFRRLSRFRYRLPHVSQSALAAFCEAAKAGELPELHSRKDQLHARNAQLSLNTPYGAVEQVVALHPQPPYRSAELRVVSPQAFLTVAFQNGGGASETSCYGVMHRRQVPPKSHGA
jgi:hypothetical protein